MSSTPRILLTSTTSDWNGISRVRLNAIYVSAVERAGGLPLLLPPLESADPGAVIDAVHGVILTGGEDVDPTHYDAAMHPDAFPPHTSRDRTELAIVRAAHERRVPLLAICRGVQLLNVAFGGTLIQHIPAERPSEIVHDHGAVRSQRTHTVELAAGSRIADLTGSTSVAVNSIHHQAVDRVGAGLRVTGRAPDGLVESVEWQHGDWWAVGVQWHPEELTGDDRPWDRALFDALVKESRTHLERVPAH